MAEAGVLRGTVGVWGWYQGGRDDDGGEGRGWEGRSVIIVTTAMVKCTHITDAKWGREQKRALSKN